MDLAQTIRDLRKAKKMSQASLADLAGTTQSKISGIENGTANVELATLRSVCAALDAEIAIIPRRITGSVRNLIEQHLNRADHQQTPRVVSVKDELFIPDPTDDDDDRDHRQERSK
jgi:transcriptional regulator with XRE-family HTH domain